MNEIIYPLLGFILIGFSLKATFDHLNKKRKPRKKWIRPDIKENAE